MAVMHTPLWDLWLLETLQCQFDLFPTLHYSPNHYVSIKL